VYASCVRRVVVGCLLSAVLAVPIASGHDHQTATVKVAVGAEVEVLPRIPELATVEGPLSLFAGNPFAGTPPKAVRAVVWRYWFTTAAERARTGAW
jgi:hypothetical protein